MALTRIKLNQITQPLDQDLSVPLLTAQSVNITDTTEASNTTIAALTVAGGIASQKDLIVGGGNAKVITGDSSSILTLERTGVGASQLDISLASQKATFTSSQDGFRFIQGSNALYETRFGVHTFNTSTGATTLTLANDGNATFSGDLTVSGDLLVSGNTTTLNVDTLAIEDLNITLANGAANSAVADGAGITIGGAGSTLTYDNSFDSWKVNKDLRIQQAGSAEVNLEHTGANAVGNYIGGVNLHSASYDNIVRMLGFNDDNDVKGGKFQIRMNNLDSTPVNRTRLEILNDVEHTKFYPSYIGDQKYVSVIGHSTSQYNNAGVGDVERVVSGLRFNWYSNYWQIGAERSTGSDISSYTMFRDGILRQLITRTGQHQIHANNTGFAAGSAGTLRLEEKEDDIPAVLVFKSVAANSGVGNLGAIWFDAGADGATANNRLHLSAKHQDNTTPTLTVSGNGYVGINQTNPDVQLEVVNTNGSQASEVDKRIAGFYKTASNAGDEGYIHLGNGDGHYGIKLGFNMEQGTPNYHNHGFYLSTVYNNENITNHVKRFVVKSNGRIGIGEDDPDSLLHLSATSPNVIIQDTSGVSNGGDYGSIKWRSSNNNINAKIVARQDTGTSGGSLSFYTRTYADGNNPDGGEERLVIDHNGKIWAYGNVDTGNYAINGLRQKGNASASFTANSYYYLCSTNSSYNGASSGFDVTIHDTQRTRSVVVSIAVKNASGISSANGTVYGSGVSGFFIIGYRQADNYTTHYYIKNTNGVSYTPRWAVSNMVGDSYIESSPPTTGITETFSIDCGVAFFGNRVGIGETAPLGKLHIKDGDAGAITTNNAHDTVIIEGQDNTGINIFSPSTSFQYLAFGDPTSSNAGYVRYYHAADQMVLRAGQADTLRVEANKASINQAPGHEAFSIAKVVTDSYTANAYNDKSTLALKAQTGVDEYASIRFTNTTGSYEFFLGTTQEDANGTATMRWQGYDRASGVYKEFATLSDSGQFTAVSKSFDIEHPTKEGMRLHHGSLEGPEHGVYVRGRLKDNNTIELPDYWTGLVDEDTITVQLTAIGSKQDLWVEDIDNNTITVGSSTDINCFYFVQAERKDIDKFDVEYEDS